jgi:hypothetical protein
MRLTRSRTKRETLAKALDELVKSAHRTALADALGTGIFETTEAELLRRRRTHARRLYKQGKLSLGGLASKLDLSLGETIERLSELKIEAPLDYDSYLQGFDAFRKR